MAAPAWQANGTAAGGAAAITLVWPGHATDDIGLLVIETSGDGTTLTPSGWAHVTGSPLADIATIVGSKLHVLWKRATSAAEANVVTADSGDHQVGQIITFRGCITTGDPWDAVASAAKTIASNTVTCPTVTTSVDECLIVFAASRPNDLAALNKFGVPVNAALTGLAEAQEMGAAGGNGGGGVVSYGTKATAGVVGTSTMSTVESTTDVSFTIALKPPAAAGTTVTPGVASLATASFVPTVTASDHKTVIPGVAALTTATFAPTVTASDHQTVTPPVASVTTSTFVPSVAVGVNVVPATASLTTAAFAPTVTASDHQTVTPGAASLSTSAFAPTVTASDHQTVTPPTLTIVLTAFAPTVTATAHQTVTPATAALSLTVFDPTVDAGQNVTVTPDAASLSVAVFDPTVTVTDHQTITPDPAALISTGFAPSVTASDHKVIIPAPASVTLAAFAPTVTATDPQLVTPGTAALSLTTFAPSVNAGVTVDVGLATLALASFAPDVLLTDNQLVTPAAASLVLTTFAATVTGDAPTTTAGIVRLPKPSGSISEVDLGGSISYQHAAGTITRLPMPLSGSIED